MRLRRAVRCADSKRAIRRGLRLQAQPFESHTEGAQAPSSLPPGNKKTASGGFFCFLAEAVRFDAKLKNLSKLGTYFN
jgi:hypothetical protein